MRVSKIAAACCMSLAVSPFSYAQDIKGVVSNSAGKPIANANVAVVNSNYKTTTDRMGNYVLSGLNAGNLELHVNAKSFSHKNRRITLGESNVSGVDFELHKSVIEVIDVHATPLHSSNIESANPISVLAGDELKLKQASTLGETLKNEIGVHSTYFGPVASSPIIRGMDGPRVLVTQNGLDAGDASRVGPDHLVTSETATAQQIEVLRGPSTLFYGSGAIGGVINVVDTRVPTTLDSSFDYMLKHNDVASEDEASFALNTSTGQLAFHLDGFLRDGDDYEIPGYAESENAHNDEHEEDHDEHEEEHDEHEEELGSYGTLASSASKSSGFTVGTSYILDNGFVGFSAGQITREYGIPGHSHGHEEEHDDHDELEEETHEEGVYADLEQTRVQMLSELTFEKSFFNKFTSKVAYTDYEHKEIEGDEIGTTFKNEMTEARFDLFHKEYNGWKGAFNFHYKDSEFEAIGEEAFTPPSDTTSYAFAWLEEKHLSDNVLVQLGLRVEHVEIEADDSMLEHHDELEEDHDEHEEDHDEHEEEHEVHFETQEFDPISLSAGLVWEYEHGYNLGLSVSYSQRAPSAAELFSNGPHIGTSSYELGALYEVHLEDEEVHFEIGEQEVELETSKNIDLTLRKFEGDFGFVVSAFYNQIDDYYFQASTGLFADDGHEHEHEEDHDEHEEDHDEHEEDHDEHEEGLPVYIFQQHDVNMYGIEAEFVYQWNDVFKTTVFTDYIKAEIDGGGNLPRIPPMRFGGQLDYVENNFAANLSVTHYFDQGDVAELETETDGYTMVDANFNYYLDGIGSDFVVFVKANNITNEEARVHTSFLKDLAPLPARGFEIGIRGSF